MMGNRQTQKKRVLSENGKTFDHHTFPISIEVKQKKSYGVLKPSGIFFGGGGDFGGKSRKI
jgi:hypothetical protein